MVATLHPLDALIARDVTLQILLLVILVSVYRAAVRRQTAVNVYFSSKRLLLFAFAGQYSNTYTVSVFSPIKSVILVVAVIIKYTSIFPLFHNILFRRYFMYEYPILTGSLLQCEA